MKFWMAHLLVVASGAMLIASCNARQQVPEADAVYRNGKIYTVNDKQPWAEAVAIKAGKFLKVGTNDEVKAVMGTDTKVIDLGGKFVMPGLHDTHLHFESFYSSEMLEGAMLKFSAEQTSIEQLQQALKAYADQNPDLKVLFAEQLPLTLFPNLSPTKDFIDEVISDRPVVMLTDTEHEAVLNSKALAMEGITAETPTPSGGEIVKDPKTGEPTGFLKETAAGIWGWSHFPQLTPAQHKQGALAVMKYLNSIGITSVKQQHAKNPVATAFQALEKDGTLTMRVALSWTYKGPLEPMPLEEQEKMIAERHRYASEVINTEFVKLSLDGTVGTTGLVVEPYLLTGDKGIAFYTLEDLAEDIGRFDAMGIGVTVHANGDGAGRLMLDALELMQRTNGELKARHQLGHAVLIHPEDLRRLKAVNLTTEFSPVVWFPSDLVAGLAGQVGPDRLNRVWPMNSVAEHGGRFVIASDGPLSWREPLEALEAAVTRQVPGGSDDALAPGEAIDLATAIKAMTSNSAYLMSQDASVGTIEVGKRADMVVLDKNLFEIPPTEIAKSTVQLTIFDGQVVYDATSDATGEESIEEHYNVELDLSGEEGYKGNKWHEEQIPRK